MSKNIKYLADRLLALILILILFIPLILLYFACSLDTKSSGLFLHERIGKNGKAFQLIKFKSIKGIMNSSVSTHAMPISHWGKFIRKYKLDELPQLINILKGEMSFVGPRPDVAEFINLIPPDKRNKFLSVPPGLTGPAQLIYFNEMDLISKNKNPEKFYKEVLWPKKVAINLQYINNWSLQKDLTYLLKTPLSFLTKHKV